VSNLAVLEFWATIAGIATSVGAAFFWLRASLTTIPPFPDVGFDSHSGIFEPVRSALQLASSRNATAAFFASLAALSSAVVFICHVLQR
jgi:hypothetical protein